MSMIKHLVRTTFGVCGPLLFYSVLDSRRSLDIDYRQHKYAYFTSYVTQITVYMVTYSDEYSCQCYEILVNYVILILSIRRPAIVSSFNSRCSVYCIMIMIRLCTYSSISVLALIKY